MKTDWMPINPCDECILKQEDNYGCVFNLTCAKLPDYLSQKFAQKRLLEYQRDNYSVLSKTTIEQMLKDLEAQNGR